ncbi:hypothetical protein A6F68_00906 [Tsuneonella dongtanensis]|uniref:Glycosyl transferase family 28 C-terminal domain-containing protein n=1 Tax=Tsuneonella dongtanensis TaxID=692370 RepID=A0A1B2ABB4_9SPHN|nr:glycosyltransferase [Tsuneonella dongtanensis]ANY19432.1 hypothetical protein A6F68_00906 [Tsuneonella dongtanensis]
MILATAGTQLPFPRMLRALDRIAEKHGLRVVAQTCGNLAGARALEQREFIEPQPFAEMLAQADVVVSHAGIGTILAASRARKPLILYPRVAALGEHRNEHQRATAKAMAGRRGIHVAWDDATLSALLTGPALAPLEPGHSPELPGLISAVSEFVSGR